MTHDVFENGKGLRFDHVVLGMRDLDTGRSAVEAVGFSTSDGGTHAGRGTANELVRLTTGYLELLTVVDREVAYANGGSRRQAAEFLDAHPAGLLGFAIEVDDLETYRTRLREGGVATSCAQAMTRVQSDGHRVSWQTVLIEDRQWLSPHPFLIQWDRGQDRWRGAPAAHPNGVTRVSGVVVTTADLDHTAAIYRALGAVALEKEVGRLRLQLGNVVVEARQTPTPPHSQGRLESVALAGRLHPSFQPQLEGSFLGQWLKCSALKIDQS